MQLRGLVLLLSIGGFYEKELEKTGQEKFRIEKSV